MSASTKERILDAAEELFSLHGLDVAVREIVALAEVNVAAVNYHFGSRQRLVTAIVARKWAALARCRAEAVRELVEREPHPSVRETVAALVGAGAAFVEAEGEAGRRWLQVTADLWLARHPVLLMAGAEVAAASDADERWEELLRAALPHLSAEVFHLRLGYAVDTLIAGRRFSDPPLFRPSEGVDEDTRMRALIDFVTAGLEAPAP